MIFCEYGLNAEGAFRCISHPGETTVDYMVYHGKPKSPPPAQEAPRVQIKRPREESG